MCIQEIYICDVLRDLVQFVQFKKRGKHPWRSITFSHSSMGVFHVFKLYKWNQIAQRITFFYLGVKVTDQ